MLDIVTFSSNSLENGSSDSRIQHKYIDRPRAGSIPAFNTTLAFLPSTMPFNELQRRRDSWPPTIIHIRDGNTDVEAIDEDPFSFFLTSPEDLDEDDFGIEDLSAGIESDDDSKPEVRSVSPSALQRSPLPDIDDEDDSFGFAMPLSLKDFTVAHIHGRESRAAHRSGEGLKGLGINLPELTATRGRSQIRLTPSRSGRGRGHSLPARRPHSWRAPSPEVYSIREERESDDGKDDKGKGIEMAEVHDKQIASAPPSAMIPREEAASPKPKKRVHWAF